MNCKQGDLAIVVRSCAGNEGKIVTYVRYMGYGYVNLNNVFITDGIPGWNEHVWEIDRLLPDKTGKIGNFAYDSQLRPLRGNLTDDEEEIVKELYPA